MSWFVQLPLGRIITELFSRALLRVQHGLDPLMNLLIRPTLNSFHKLTVLKIVFIIFLCHNFEYFPASRAVPLKSFDFINLGESLSAPGRLFRRFILHLLVKQRIHRQVSAIANSLLHLFDRERSLVVDGGACCRQRPTLTFRLRYFLL